MSSPTILSQFIKQNNLPQKIEIFINNNYFLFIFLIPDIKYTIIPKVKNKIPPQSLVPKQLELGR